jgi:hypothetical protein
LQDVRDGLHGTTGFRGVRLHLVAIRHHPVTARAAARL